DARLLDDDALQSRLEKPDDERLFLVAEAFRRGWTVGRLQRITGIDWWFLRKIENIVRFEERLAEGELDAERLREAKRMGFADRSIAEIRREAGLSSAATEDDVRALRLAHGIRPVYKMVDTCAAEFEASTPYY